MELHSNYPRSMVRPTPNPVERLGGSDAEEIAERLVERGLLYIDGLGPTPLGMGALDARRPQLEPRSYTRPALVAGAPEAKRARFEAVGGSDRQRLYNLARRLGVTGSASPSE
jgi:hypothetical protein